MYIGGNLRKEKPNVSMEKLDQCLGFNVRLAESNGLSSDLGAKQYLSEIFRIKIEEGSYIIILALVQTKHSEFDRNKKMQTRQNTNVWLNKEVQS